MRSTVSFRRWRLGRCCGDVDDGEIEGLERGAGGPCDALEAGMYDVAGVLGGEQEEQPLLLARPVLEVGWGSGWEALHRRALLRWVGSPQVLRKSFSSRTSLSCSEAAASRTAAMTVSVLGLPPPAWA